MLSIKNSWRWHSCGCLQDGFGLKLRTLWGILGSREWRPLKPPPWRVSLELRGVCCECLHRSVSAGQEPQTLCSAAPHPWRMPSMRAKNSTHRLGSGASAEQLMNGFLKCRVGMNTSRTQEYNSSYCNQHCLHIVGLMVETSNKEYRLCCLILKN